MHLDRLALILEIVGQTGRATVSDICARSELPKPTAYRLVQDLVSSGLLDAPKRGEFTIGTRLKRITSNDHSDRALLGVIAPVLAKAAKDHGAAFFLSRLRGHWVEIIHVATPDTGVSYLHPGVGRRPLHACSCAKSIAAVSPDLLVDNKLTGQLKQYTEHTISNRNDFLAELETVRAKGYAECVEELEHGICSVAVALSQTGFGATLSIGATASLRVVTPTARKAIGRALIEMSQDISRVLGLEDVVASRKSA